MTEVAVLDSGDDDIAGKIASRIDEYGGNTGVILIRSVRSLNEIMKKKPDILVLADDAAMSCRVDSQGVQNNARIDCGILLMPGDSIGVSRDTEIFDAGCIVTYGMSPKNTVTFSSIGEDTCILTLQRELVTITGDVLERQEINIKGEMRPDSLLAVAGTLLLLGLRISDTNQ